MPGGVEHALARAGFAGDGRVFDTFYDERRALPPQAQAEGVRVMNEAGIVHTGCAQPGFAARPVNNVR